MLAVQAAKNVVLGRPFHVVAHKKIQLAVPVVVKPKRRCTKSQPVAQTRGIRCIHKRAFARISEQPILAHACNQNVRKAIVVVVPDGHAHAVHFDVEPSSFRYVEKRSIAIVLI